MKGRRFLILTRAVADRGETERLDGDEEKK